MCVKSFSSDVKPSAAADENKAAHSFFTFFLKLIKDVIKQFHSKYLCLTAKDELSIELIKLDSG